MRPQVPGRKTAVPDKGECFWQKLLLGIMAIRKRRPRRAAFAVRDHPGRLAGSHAGAVFSGSGVLEDQFAIAHIDLDSLTI